MVTSAIVVSADIVFVSPRFARHEGVGDPDHEPWVDGRLVIRISRALVRAGRKAGHTNTASRRRPFARAM